MADVEASIAPRISDVALSKVMLNPDASKLVINVPEMTLAVLIPRLSVQVVS